MYAEGVFSSRTAWSTSPNKLSTRLKRLRRSGAELFDLTESNPTRCGFLYDEERVRQALSGADVMSYDPNPRGLRVARDAVAAYYEELGTPTSADRIFLTTSSSEAYAWCFRLLCEPGDEVLVPSPSYPLFDYLSDLTDVRLKRYPLLYDHGWSIDVEYLAGAITPRTKAILTVSPNNPTGSMLQSRERDMLVRFAMRHDLALIADEVFLDYLWADGVRPETLNTRGLALSFTISGLSKVSAMPQMKMGWIVVRGPVGPDAAAAARLEVIADTYLSVSTPTQVASPVLFEQRRLLQPQIRDRIATNLAYLDRKLALDTPLSRLQADGGWYAVLRAPSSSTDEEWALFLLESTGVHVHPGHFFDFDGEARLVISLITPEPVFQEGVGRLVEAVR